MKPAPFAYHIASTADAAAAALARAEGRAKPMAGGQSLGPMLNLRLARPELLVDLSNTPDLQGAQVEDDAIVYGACVTHAQIEDCVVPDPTPGWLSAAARHIAYRAVRNRGTIGGSLAHADPAADWVNIMMALGSSVLVAGPGGARAIAASQFMTGSYTTALAPDEIIAGLRILRRTPDARWGYWKFCRKAGDFAQASASVLVDAQRGDICILIGAIETTPAFLSDPEEILAGRRSIRDAVAQALPGRGDEGLGLHVAAVTRALAIARGERD